MKMTAQRLVARAGRSRFFIGIGLLILMVGFVAIFHSSQQQVDELRQLGLRCEQQQKAVQTQMEVVVDQKLRLENSLASERMINEENRKELRQKAQDEKEEHSKTAMESNIRYASLQQQCNLIKSQLGDVTEECAKSKKSQSEEINSLRLKVSELQGKVRRQEQYSANDVEHLKIQVSQLKDENIKAEATLRQQLSYKDEIIEKLRDLSTKMEKENAQYLDLCKISSDKIPAHHKYSDVLDQLSAVSPANAAPHRNFNEQLSVSEDLYRIPIVLKNRTATTIVTYSSSATNNGPFDQPVVDGQALPAAAPNSDEQETRVIANPFDVPRDDAVRLRSKGGGIGAAVDGGIINSVENFQIIPKPLPVVDADDGANRADSNGGVLQEPQLIKTSTPGTVARNRKTSSERSMQVPILAAPTVISPESGKSSPSSTASTTSTKASGVAHSSNSAVRRPLSKLRSKPLPEGIVPFPDTIPDLQENNSDNVVDNRYTNVAAAAALTGTGSRGIVTNGKKSGGKDKEHSDLNFMNGNAELENGAHEVNDNDFNLGGANAQNGMLLQHAGGRIGANNDNLNNAEEDTNLYDNGNKLFANALAGPNMDYNEGHPHNGMKRDGVGAVGVGGAGGAKSVGIGDKLINEIARDHGKEGDNYPNELDEDLHLDGQQEGEEEGDVGEYDDPTALKQGHAERN